MRSFVPKKVINNNSTIFERVRKYEKVRHFSRRVRGSFVFHPTFKIFFFTFGPKPRKILLEEELFLNFLFGNYNGGVYRVCAVRIFSLSTLVPSD